MARSGMLLIKGTSDHAGDFMPWGLAACLAKGLGQSMQKLGFLPEANNDTRFFRNL
ncbi:MAG: hypothetical protein ACLTS6_10235 [Anaerobutyricum sp.]